MTITELIAEVRALTGREDDTVLITEARVLRLLNDAQYYIASKCLGHIDLETKIVAGFTLVENQYEYDLTTITPEVLHVLDVYFIDGTQSKLLDYIVTPDFDANFPSVADCGAGSIPLHYTRRGKLLEIHPYPDASAAGKTLRLNYTKRPTAFTLAASTAVCDMADADTGLLYHALKEAWGIIGGDSSGDEIAKYENKFPQWLEEYRQMKDGLYGSDGISFF